MQEFLYTQVLPHNTLHCKKESDITMAGYMDLTLSGSLDNDLIITQPLYKVVLGMDPKDSAQCKEVLVAKFLLQVQLAVYQHKI